MADWSWANWGDFLPVGTASLRALSTAAYRTLLTKDDDVDRLVELKIDGSGSVTVFFGPQADANDNAAVVVRREWQPIRRLLPAGTAIQAKGAGNAYVEVWARSTGAPI